MVSGCGEAAAFTATRRFFLRQPPRLREGSCVLPAVKGIVRKLFLVNSSLLEGGGFWVHEWVEKTVETSKKKKDIVR